MDDFFRVSDHLNLTACMLTPFENRKVVAEAAKKHPRQIIPFGFVDVDAPDVTHQVEEFHAMGYRGLGELMIALSYGPWMVLGSLYLHTRGFSWAAFAASFVPACFIMALAVVNAIPDFHQDRLVGKRNLVVRVGRENAVYLYLALAGAGLAVIVMGVIARAFPLVSLVALLAAVPVAASARCALRNFSAPRQFLPAMRSMVVAYIVVTGIFTAAIFTQSLQ